MNLMSGQTYQKLEQLCSGLTSKQTILIDKIRDEISSNLPKYTKMTDFRKPVKKVETVFLKNVAHYTSEEQMILKRALLAKLALRTPTIVEGMNLPVSILALYPDAFVRLADFLQSIGLDQYDSTGEFFCKDIRFVLGLSIPCGVLVIDVVSSITLPSLILSAFRSRDVKGIIRYAHAGGMGTWFRGHLDSRYVTEFNEHGFDNFYIRVAELLKQNTNVRGYVGTSWLYDPQLLKISPHLAFFQERPPERGAFSLKHGTQPSDIAFAIKASKNRSNLYKERKYIPVCYSSLWPRKELMTWAEKWRSENTISTINSRQLNSHRF